MFPKRGLDLKIKFKFPGRGQGMTPVADRKTVLEMIIPGVKATEYRNLSRMLFDRDGE